MQTLENAAKATRDAVNGAAEYTRDAVQRMDARLTDALSNKTRPAFATADPEAIRVLYRAPISPAWRKFVCCYGVLNPCSCVLCHLDFVQASTYAHIHENRVELNYPARPTLRGLLMRWISTYLRPCTILSCGEIRDAVEVVYFDKITGQGRALCCYPLCTHWDCCPTCCDSCGEGAVLFDDDDCHIPCFCRDWVMVPGLVNADEFIKEVKAARSAWKERQQALKQQQKSQDVAPSATPATMQP